MANFGLLMVLGLLREGIFRYFLCSILFSSAILDFCTNSNNSAAD